MREERNIIQNCQDYRLVERLTESSSTFTKQLPLEECDITAVDVNWANQLAEKVHRELQLGYYPAKLLAESLEEDYGVLLITSP